MAIQETPINIKTYYKIMRDRSSKELVEAREDKNELEIKNRKLHDKLEENAYVYIQMFGITLKDYPEFVENKYIDGTLYKNAKGLFMNRQGDYKIVADLYDIFTYGNTQNNIHELELKIKHLEKLVNLTLKEYTEILRVYYTEVHKKLILEGKGYAFTGRLGWTCVNRVILVRPKKHIDYAATRRREQELKAQGKRIYNKEEAEWCKNNGIEYVAEDKRVFQDNEYCYEIPLIDNHIKGDLKLTIADYRHTKLRGKTNEQLIEECDNDVNKIVNLPVDVKTKLTLCDKVDKILYTKFIRNETQKPFNIRKANS